MSFPQALEGDKLRGKAEKFADHYTQATLFYDSQTEVEKAHLIGGFRFELSKLTVPAIRERMLASLVNVSADMTAKIAAGLGVKVPEAMPWALARSMQPEVVKSSALSLTALPGDGGIRTRKVAILVADGVYGASIVAIQAALAAAGAVACIVAPRLGPVKTADGRSVEATGTLENSPPVLFDALVLPDGGDGVTLLAGYGQTREFVTNHYRHGKTILALGASKALLDKADVAATLPSGEPDPGILLVNIAALGDSTAAFLAAVGKHRHPLRETDPPRI